MKTVILISVCSVGLVVAPVSATIINVPGDCPTIQAGIDSSSDGDTVLVQPDTYYENINFNGHNIVLGSLFLTTCDTSYILTTIIDGDSAGAVVTFESGEDSFTVITGFTIQYGLSGFGGGVKCDHSSPTISDNYIIHNSTIGNQGGGVGCDSSNAVIRNNTIIHNYANMGGGIGCDYYSQPAISNNVITYNISRLGGGGIWCHNQSHATIVNNIIMYSNRLIGSGAGVWCEHSDATIKYNFIDSNIGGGIICHHSSPYIAYNTISNNTGVTYSGGIHARISSADILYNEIVGNEGHYAGGGICVAGGNYALVKYNTVQGNHSISADGGGILIHQFHANISVTNNVITANISDLRGGGMVISCPSSDVVIDSNNIVCNFSIQGGGGITIENNSNPIIRDNNISENTTEGKGGAILVYRLYNSPTWCELINNTIENNFAGEGGGIYVDYRTTATITDNEILNNSAICGGGIYCYGTRSTINRNLILGNSATGADSAYGGGIVCAVLADPLISNNILYGNSSQGYGGGLGVIGGSIPYLINNILWHDTAVYDVEIFVDNTSLLEISYCDIEGGWGGEGNIDMDPNFCDPGNDDFHLMAVVCGDSVDSPCIDAGKPDVLDDSLDCDWGLGTVRSDMGAYGGNDSMVVGIDVDEHVIPVDFSLYQNYPNPFNASTVLRYSLPQPGEVKLVVYNVLGQKVGTVFEGVKQAGTHNAVWDGGDVSSGIYFTVLSSGGRSETIKMLLMK